MTANGDCFDEVRVNDAVIMRISGATTRIRGGDAGHGGVTTIAIDNLTTDIQLMVDGEKVRAHSVALIFRGDAESRATVIGLQAVLKGLAAQLKVDSHRRFLERL